MAISDVTLSASARSNLLALQSTATMLGQTQEALSTGKKVNSALDDATSYFASQGFLNSANDLSNLNDSMSTALQTITAASNAITSLTSVVTQLQGVVNSALQTTDTATRAGLASQYNGLLTQLDSLANDASFNGTNLVNSLTSELKIDFNTSNTTNLTVSGSNLTSAGLGLGAAVSGFAENTMAQEVTSALTAATDPSTLTNAVYGGTLTGLSVTGAATQIGSGSGSGAKITSDSQIIAGVSQAATDGATIMATATVNTAPTTLTNALASTALGQEGVTVTTVAAPTNSAGTASSSASNQTTVAITGQFSVTGGSASVFSTTGKDGSPNTLVNNSTTTTSESVVTVGIGQTIQIAVDYGNTTTTPATVTQYTNNTGAAITFNLGDATAGVTTNGTLSYNGAGATAAAALTASTVVQSNSAPVATTGGTATAITTPGGVVITTAAAADEITDAGNIATAVTDGTLTAVGTANNSGANGSAPATIAITGQYTYLDGGATHQAIVIGAGQSIQVQDNPGVAAHVTLTNYQNQTDHDVVIALGTNSLMTVATNGTNTNYAANSTVSYTLGAGSVSTTGVTLDDGQTLNGNTLINALGVANGGSVTVSQTSAATAAQIAAGVGTTTQTGITNYDASSATITAIGAAGVKATIDGTGATTYSGANLEVSLSGVKVLTGSSTTVVADSLTTAQDELTAALAELRTASSSLGNNNTLVTTRQTFTTNLINTLQTASDNLVLADSNTEGANMQSLQAQDQLGIVSLGISGQLAQAILKLF
jgi:flagellin-like hook-associated protein FlgL